MKKIFLSLIALFALFTITSCEMTYDKDYPELIQYWCCWGDNAKWNDHSNPAKTLMTYNSSNSTYVIEVETLSKNQRFEITKGASYSLEYCYFNKNTGSYSQDTENQSAFPKTADNGYGSLQTVLPSVGKYIITFDAATALYSVAAK